MHASRYRPLTLGVTSACGFRGVISTQDILTVLVQFCIPL